MKNKCITPCKNCPWRKSVRPHDIPGGGLELDKDLTKEGLPFLGAVMQCHLTADTEPQPCAGFVTQVGFESVALRYTVMTGVVDPNHYQRPDDDELYSSFPEMITAYREFQGDARQEERNRSGYHDLSPREQWEWDKQRGGLDD